MSSGDLYVLEQANRSDPNKYGYGKGVDAFLTLRAQGPTQHRVAIDQIGSAVYRAGGLNAVNKFFEGLSSTQGPERLINELRSRLQKMMLVPSQQQVQPQQYVIGSTGVIPAPPQAPAPTPPPATPKPNTPQ